MNDNDLEIRTLIVCAIVILACMAYMTISVVRAIDAALL